MSNILITGHLNGLGKAMFDELTMMGHTVAGFDVLEDHDVVQPDPAEIMDLLCQAQFGHPCREDVGTPTLDVLINNAGINLIDWLESFGSLEWDRVMDVNAKGIFAMTKACLPLLIESKGTVLNITSNAAHMPMTCSAAYNASKGAAHILTLQLARELTKRYGITVFGIAPNKLADTEMSRSIDDQVVRTRGWTPEYAHQYQINGLLAGEETPPERVAQLVAFLLHTKNHHKHLTGCILPYGA